MTLIDFRDGYTFLLKSFVLSLKIFAQRALRRIEKCESPLRLRARLIV